MERIKLTLVMLLWGSIGIFTRSIDLTPIMLAFLRAVVALPLLGIMARRKKDNQKNKLKELIPYMVSGAMLGLAWAALFLGYKNTSVSTAIVIYNMCPVYVMMLSPLILKEKLNKLQVSMIGMAFIGLLMVIGRIQFTYGQLSGIIASGISGLLYAVIVIMNRKFSGKVDHNRATFIQMTAAAVILIPFVVLEGDMSMLVKLEPVGYAFIFMLGIVHTGIAYNLYFSVYEQMSSMEIVTFSYLEPAFGIFLSMIFLNEKMTATQFLGALLILGLTYFGEYLQIKRTAGFEEKIEIKERRG